ncbi:ABC transporter substrate-binding protein [Desulfomonile tiedjei]|uniref:ABC transporter, substrate-binding protein, aliphatic sulfonates family n=1 Tax=Desulfomonile tiedjei (strain ATCC 49306 / DSM 6799 / DCB-1) TaxID=706587 RepID=I4CEE4_DESTA|nr:ABC transporter substrate-binding protein [Desulfomonile tiedjei]AFM27935.1 ABC transporter, substrate-binding protein, aliphatic sulfonates family [Desulfomonile tiedjei DSM 6799]
MKRVALALFSLWFGLIAIGTANSQDKLDQPIRMAYLQNDIHHLPLWIAIDKGFFNEQGLKVNIAGIFRSGPEVMSAFSAGAIDMAYVGEAPTVTAAANGTVKVAILAQVNTEGSAIVVGKDSPIADISSLKGKQIAVPGYSTVQDFLLRKAFGDPGSDRNGTKVTVIKPPEMLGALRTNQIDGFIAWEPYPAQAVRMGIGKVLVSSSDIWKNHPCCVLVADKRFAETNGARIKKIVEAHQKSIDFIREKQDEAVGIAVKYTGLDEETIRNAMKNVTYVSSLNVEGLREYVKFLNGLGYIKLNNLESFIEKIVY